MDKKLVTITEFESIGEDQRGVTKKYSLPRNQGEFIYLTRKSGSISGNTYHLGKNTGTNPKIFVLLSGEIKFSYREVGTDRVLVENITAPSLIEVSPMVTHKVEALSDIQILECNSIEDIQNDRVREDVCLEKQNFNSV